MANEEYDTARICESGHLINDASKHEANRNTNFCIRCGAIGIDKCPSCSSSVRGTQYFWSQNVVAWLPGKRMTRIPSYCHDCGVAYPWTAGRLEAARELISEARELTYAERDILNATLPDLVRDTPKSQVAAVRYQKVVAKLANGAKEGLKKILWEVATESVKKTLFGS